MTAEELHEMVMKWPAEYRELPGYGIYYDDGGWWLPDDPCPTDIAAMLLCHHAEGVLMSGGLLTLNLSTVDGQYVVTRPAGMHYGGGTTRLAAIDALIRQIEGIKEKA